MSTSQKLLFTDNYTKAYADSQNNPEAFWRNQIDILSWHKTPTKILEGTLSEGTVSWFSDGTLNACENCLDRHLPLLANKTALIWEGDTPDKQRHLSYQNLYDSVCQMANVLKQQGVTKGCRVCIYMPMIPEAVMAMLACARIGAIHSVVFGGFSPNALAHRIDDAQCQWIITADGSYRGGKLIPLKDNVDKALTLTKTNINTVMVVKHTQTSIDWHDTRDLDLLTAMSQANKHCDAMPVKATNPLFILYTSGSTGTPKGVCHATGGYLLYATLTHREAFDLQDNDVFWCTADVGWITGHSYIAYAPLANGCTQVIFEGVPNFPTPARFWELVDRHQVTLFYTAPTALRALERAGNSHVQATQRTSLRMLGSVGEPINPSTWNWYSKVIGQERCPIMDTWWQTETGGFMLLPPPELDQQKPGASMRPFLGVVPVIVDDDGHEIEGEGSGRLLIKSPWPGMMMTVFGDHQRFINTYLKNFPGYYETGDAAIRDAEGDLWITGRTDDVLNVSGHRLGTAEIESAIVTHPNIAEAAVVGFEHPIKGEGIYAFVTPMSNIAPSDTLKKEVTDCVRQTIGPIAKPDCIQWTSQLPKTRSGKIMRRILRKIVTHDIKQIGDTSTLADPNCIQNLIADSVALPV